MKRLLALSFLALSGCVTYAEQEAARYRAENAAREDAAKAEAARRGGKYLATIALFPSGSGGTGCVLKSVAPAMTPGLHLDLLPSEAFMRTACAHFKATWQTPESPLHYSEMKINWEAVWWFADDPDTPLYSPTFML